MTNMTYHAEYERLERLTFIAEHRRITDAKPVCFEYKPHGMVPGQTAQLHVIWSDASVTVWNMSGQIITKFLCDPEHIWEKYSEKTYNTVYDAALDNLNNYTYWCTH